MKSSKRKKRWWLLILPLLLIIGAVGFWLAKGRPDLSVPGTGSKQEALPTAEVVTGSIEVITEGSGSVEAATVNNISLKYGGKFSSILVEEGDQVSEGQILAEYDPDSLDTVIKTKEDELDELNSNISSQSRAGSSSITSPVSGRIKKIYAEEDDDVSDVTERYGGVAEIFASRSQMTENMISVKVQKSLPARVRGLGVESWHLIILIWSVLITASLILSGLKKTSQFIPARSFSRFVMLHITGSTSRWGSPISSLHLKAKKPCGGPNLLLQIF